MFLDNRFFILYINITCKYCDHFFFLIFFIYLSVICFLFLLFFNLLNNNPNPLTTQHTTHTLTSHHTTLSPSLHTHTHLTPHTLTPHTFTPESAGIRPHNGPRRPSYYPLTWEQELAEAVEREKEIQAEDMAMRGTCSTVQYSIV